MYVFTMDHQCTDLLTLHAGVGYAMADDEPAGRGDEYGWEADLGASYELMENLRYEAHFGYLNIGDFFDGDGAHEDVDDIYLLTHHLTMTF